ncbi:MAG: CRISPR-associated protein Cas5 [Methanobacteriota archaeon]
MDAIKIKTVSGFASFKWVKDQKYHRTYEFPPKTTLLGFVGSALGLKEEQIYHRWGWNGKEKPFVDRVKVAILANTIDGKVKEAWRTIKSIKGKAEREIEVLFLEGWTFTRIPIVREQLYRPRYVIYVSSDEGDLLRHMMEKFGNPVFPLSLGRDDELVRIESLSILPLIEPKYPILLHNILLPFNINKVKRGIVLEGTFKPYICQKLPHRFEIIDKIRKPKDEGEFTFLTGGYKIKIEEPIKNTYYDPEEDRNVVFL